MMGPSSQGDYLDQEHALEVRIRNDQKTTTLNRPLLSQN
jgi:hypothetical protein